MKAKTRFHLYAVVEEPLARQVAETAYRLGLSQAALVRWAAIEFLGNAEARIAALQAAGAAPPPPMGAMPTPKSRPNRNAPKASKGVPGIDHPF